MSLKRVRKTEFPKTITRSGVTAKIYKNTLRKKNKDGDKSEHVTFMVSYTLLGVRKMKGFADLDEATSHAEDACEKISNGEHASLQLTNDARMTYLRAIEAAAPTGKPLDVVAREYAEAF